MRSSILIPLIIGLGAGVFALWALIGYFQERNEQIRKPVERIAIVVAKTDIPYAAEITADMLRDVLVAAPNPFENTFADTESVVGRVSALTIVNGMPILANTLAPEHTTPGARHQIPFGWRLVSVEVPAHTVSEMDPGDHVDIFYAAQVRQGAGSSLMKPILGNVEIYAVGEKRRGMRWGEDPSEKGDKKARATAGRAVARGGLTVVKLLLSLDQASLLISAVRNGEIQLMARRYGDDTPLPDVTATLEELAGTQEPQIIHSDETAPPPVRVNTVSVLHKGQEETITFYDGERQVVEPPPPSQTKPRSPRADVSSAPERSGLSDAQASRVLAQWMREHRPPREVELEANDLGE